MKKIFVLMASAAVLFAACNKMEEVNTPVDTPAETEVITVVLNPVTKTSLDGKATLWTAGDEVSVTVGGKNIGTLALVEGSTFSGEVEAGHDGAATLNYPAGVTAVPASQAAVKDSFADGAALLEGTTTMAALRAGEGASLSNTTALLKFSVLQAGDVTFEVGTAKYTVTGCKTGETYYACVAPASGVDFVARIGGYLSKEASNKATFTANQVANLGELPAAKTSTYSLMGINGDWNTGKVFYKDVDGSYLLKNVNITNTTEFKFTTSQGNSKTWGRPITFEKGRWAFTYDFPNDNMKGISGTYDIWVDPQNDAVCFVDIDAPKPAFTDENKLVHILYEATDNCGLYIKSPSTNVNDYNNVGAWGNYQAVYMKKTENENQNYCAFPLPSNVVGKSLNFTIRVWGNKNKTYTMTINDDTPFWGNSDNGGYYSLSSKINIQ